MLKVWAIRHAPTGHYLPNGLGKNGNGASYREPVDPKEEPPRLFMKEKSARAALAAWCRGHHKAEWETDWGDDFSSSSYTYVSDISIIPVQGRNKGQMEVVEFNMVEQR